MEYRGFYIWAKERDPGMWRAMVRRTNGTSLTGGRKKLAEAIANTDATTEADALKMAMAVIDAGDFWSRSKRNARSEEADAPKMKRNAAPSERYWRVVARNGSSAP